MLALLALFLAPETEAQQVQAVRGAYLLSSVPPPRAKIGDTLVVYRMAEQELVAVGKVVIDELPRGSAICRVASEVAPYKVQVGDWLVAPDGRVPVASPMPEADRTKPQVAAVRGGQVVIAGSCVPRVPGDTLAIARRSDSGTQPIGTARLLQVEPGYAVAAIVSESPNEQIRPGDMVNLAATRIQEAIAGAPSGPIPRVAKTRGKYVFVTGLPEDWHPGMTLEVIRTQGGSTRVIAAVRLSDRREERGIAVLVRSEPGEELQVGDQLALPVPSPLSNEDLDTYFFGTFHPRR
ncbi:MAG: hypothetical protein H5U38_08100 [Calditrichaeota bacterium]|nr:hypothetical protein [Calditrichota bacterium]